MTTQALEMPPSQTAEDSPAEEQSQPDTDTQADSGLSDKLGNVGRRSSRSKSSSKLGGVGGPGVHALAAEWLIGLCLAGVGLFFKSGNDDDDSNDMSRFSYQVMGLCIVFFVLALGMSSQKLSKACVAFGGLIDIALLLNLVTGGASGPVGSDKSST